MKNIGLLNIQFSLIITQRSVMAVYFNSINKSSLYDVVDGSV